MDIVELLGEPGAAEPDDILLAREAAAGNGAAFVCLYDRYAQRTFTFCHRLLGTRGQAAYATEQSFVRVAGQLGQIRRGKHDFRMQLYAGAHGASHGVMAAAERRTHPTTTASDLTNDAEQHSGLTIAAAHSALAPQQREVLALRELEGMTYAQIAAIADIDPAMAARSIADARINLFELLTADVAPIRTESADCRRALTLMALCDDRGAVAAEQCAWLASHLSSCAACATNQGRVREGAILYRTLPWPELVDWLRHSTIQSAAHALGVNWQAEAPAPPPPDRPSKAVVPLVIGPIGGLRTAFQAASSKWHLPTESTPEIAKRARALAPDRVPGGQGVWGGVAASALGVFVAIAVLGSTGHPASKAQLPPPPAPVPQPIASQQPPPPIEVLTGTSSAQDAITGTTDSTTHQAARRTHSQEPVTASPPVHTTTTPPRNPVSTETSTSNTTPTTDTSTTQKTTPTQTSTQPRGGPDTGTNGGDNNGPSADAGLQGFGLASINSGDPQSTDPPPSGTDPTQSSDPGSQDTTTTDTGPTTSATGP